MYYVNCITRCRLKSCVGNDDKLQRWQYTRLWRCMGIGTTTPNTRTPGTRLPPHVLCTTVPVTRCHYHRLLACRSVAPVCPTRQVQRSPTVSRRPAIGCLDGVGRTPPLPPRPSSHTLKLLQFYWSYEDNQPHTKTRPSRLAQGFCPSIISTNRKMLYLKTTEPRRHWCWPTDQRAYIFMALSRVDVPKCALPDDVRVDVGWLPSEEIGVPPWAA